MVASSKQASVFTAVCLCSNSEVSSFQSILNQEFGRHRDRKRKYRTLYSVRVWCIYSGRTGVYIARGVPVAQEPPSRKKVGRDLTVYYVYA